MTGPRAWMDWMMGQRTTRSPFVRPCLQAIFSSESRAVSTNSRPRACQGQARFLQFWLLRRLSRIHAVGPRLTNDPAMIEWCVGPALVAGPQIIGGTARRQARPYIRLYLYG